MEKLYVVQFAWDEPGGVFWPSDFAGTPIVSFCDFKFNARNLKALNLWAMSRPSLFREVARFFLSCDFRSPSGPMMSDSWAAYKNQLVVSNVTYALCLRIVVWVIFIVLIFFIFVQAIVLRDVVVSLLESLSFSLTSPELSMLFILPLCEHDHVLLEFSILLNCFQ